MSTFYHFDSGLDESIILAACFDLDWTLIKPKSTKFPKTFDDNVIMSNRINVLKSYIKYGYKIIIFTNQKVTKTQPLQFKINRMYDIINKFKNEGIDIIIYMATADNNFRKPNLGMWDMFRQKYNKLEAAFYCGDAAGRKEDFSSSDLEFANNIAIKFYTPEELFNM